MKNLSCPQCGAPLPRFDLQGFTACEYCKTVLRHSRQGHFFPVWDPAFSPQEISEKQKRIRHLKKEIDEYHIQLSSLKKRLRNYGFLLLYMGLLLSFFLLFTDKRLTFLIILWLFYLPLCVVAQARWKKQVGYSHQVALYQQQIKEREKEIEELETEYHPM